VICWWAADRRWGFCPLHAFFSPKPIYLVLQLLHQQRGPSSDPSTLSNLPFGAASTVPSPSSPDFSGWFVPGADIHPLSLIHRTCALWAFPSLTPWLVRSLERLLLFRFQFISRSRFHVRIHSPSPSIDDLICPCYSCQSVNSRFKFCSNSSVLSPVELLPEISPSTNHASPAIATLLPVSHERLVTKQGSQVLI